MADQFGGVKQVAAALKASHARGRAGGMRGIGIALQNTLRVSNSQVPHEEGDLERDGGTSVDAKAGIGAVSYGRRGQTRKYARYQHEKEGLQHDAGRNDHYLSNAVAQTREQNLQIIAEQTRKGLGT